MNPYTKAVPEDTFLWHYLKMMEGQETPLAYDFWCGLWLLSTVLGRDVYVDRPRMPIRMNWYVTLVAESGITRKSSAVRQAVDMLTNLRTRTDFVMIGGKTTPEKLTQLVAGREHGHLAIAVSEMVTFFGSESYLRAMPGLLTDWYDCPDERTGGTLEAGYTIRNLYPTLLTASTPTWLLRAINPEIIEGGFTSRCIFVHEEKRKRRIPWPEPINEDARRKALDALVLLMDEGRRYPNIRLHDGALAHFKKWYNTRPENTDAFRSSFESREDSHILRLAGMLARNARVYDIQKSHVSSAIRIISMVKEQAARLFNNPSNVNELMLGVDKMRQILISHGMSGVAQQVLTQGVKNYLRADQCLIVLEIMHDTKLVSRFDGVKMHRVGRPATIWRANKGLLGTGDVVASIVRKLQPEDV